jgi:regulator of protease activity HflC (stomatin/prohibitin superfamily)
MEYLLIGMAALGAIYIIRYGIKVITIFEYEMGLKYKKGCFLGVYGPGLYWIFPAFSVIRKIDMRPTYSTISGQEVLSLDGITLKVSLAAKYQIGEPEIAINKIANYQEALYLELQLALRQIVGVATAMDLLGQRRDFGHHIQEQTGPKAEIMGIKLLQVEIKDIMFPGDLKKVFAQVVNAQQEGLAALEKARGETAALRSLANAAKLMENNPNLMQLRIIQAMGQSTGNSFILGVSSPQNIFPSNFPNTESTKT